MSQNLKQIVDLGILGEIEVDVDYDYSPGTPDVMYMPNGDPGSPGDPAELTINSVHYEDKDVTWLFQDNDTLQDIIYDEISANAEQDAREYAADMEYERRREAAWDKEF